MVWVNGSLVEKNAQASNRGRLWSKPGSEVPAYGVNSFLCTENLVLSCNIESLKKLQCVGAFGPNRLHWELCSALYNDLQCAVICFAALCYARLCWPLCQLPFIHGFIRCVAAKYFNHPFINWFLHHDSINQHSSSTCNRVVPPQKCFKLRGVTSTREKQKKSAPFRRQTCGTSTICLNFRRVSDTFENSILKHPGAVRNAPGAFTSQKTL